MFIKKMSRDVPVDLFHLNRVWLKRSRQIQIVLCKKKMEWLMLATQTIRRRWSSTSETLAEV